MIPILTTTSTVMCPHGGQALLLTSNTEALIDGAPALLQTDIHPIVGCPFTPVAYSPCVSIRWLTGATQTSVRNVPVLLQTSINGVAARSSGIGRNATGPGPRASRNQLATGEAKTGASTYGTRHAEASTRTSAESARATLRAPGTGRRRHEATP